MAFCSECGANVRGVKTRCPACESALETAATLAAMQSEVMLAQVHLKPGREDLTDSSDGLRPTVESGKAKLGRGMALAGLCLAGAALAITVVRALLGT